ncbi:MAG: dihydrodipicolinate synthase family protein [Planctomycetaceae bacterium]
MTPPALSPASPRDSADRELSGARPRFHGIVPPLVTPLAGPDILDVEGLGRLVEHVVGGGVHGLFMLGTTGEGPSLSHALQREVIDRVVRFVAGRVPVLVGITDASMEESVSLACAAATSGADAVVAATPYYFPAAQEPLVRWARDLANRVPLPLLLYNMPEMTKVVLEPDTLRQLAACPNIVGVKDSSGDLDYFGRVTQLARHERPEWTVLIGPELLLPEAHALGGHGAIPGGANVLPRLFVDLHEAVRAGDTRRVDALRARARQLARLYDVGHMPGRIVVGLKTALSALGICCDGVASSFETFGGEQRQQVEAILDALEPTLFGIGSESFTVGRRRGNREQPNG